MKAQTHTHKNSSALITTWSNELLTMPSFYISYLSTVSLWVLFIRH